MPTRHIDEDTITQAVIARHAGAGDARLREVMTSLVQHLHGFARDVKLTEAEWRSALAFLGEVGRANDERHPEFELLSDTLGLSMLVTVLNQRRPKGCTEVTLGAPAVFADGDTPSDAPVALPSRARSGAPPAAVRGVEAAEPCFVVGRVLSRSGQPIAGAQVLMQPAEGTAAAHQPPLVARSGADGGFALCSELAQPHTVPHTGPVGRMLQALGRHPWRPAHLHFSIAAPGHESLQTQVFRRGDRYIESDAVFGVRRSLIADWVQHPPGATPDGGRSDRPFFSLNFDFVLNPSSAPT